MLGDWDARNRQLGGHMAWEFRVEIKNDAGVWVDLSSRMFGMLKDGSKVIKLPTIGTGSERGDSGAIQTQGSSVTVWNGDGWWNGKPTYLKDISGTVVNANIFENVQGEGDSYGAGYSLASVLNCVNGDTTGVKGQWLSAIGAGLDHWLWFKLAEDQALAGVRPFRISAMRITFPTDFNPAECYIGYYDEDYAIQTATIDFVNSTDISDLGSEHFSCDATTVYVVFGDGVNAYVDTTSIWIAQDSGDGNAANANQMGVIEVEPTGIYSMPRIDFTTWKGVYLRVRGIYKRPEESFDGQATNALTLNTYIIDDVQDAGDNVEITLVDVGIKLRRFEAEKIRDGDTPWQNRSPAFLMTQILVGAYPDDDVSGWIANIPNGPISIDLADTSQRAASSFGPANTWKQVGASQKVFTYADVDPGYVIEAVYWHDANSKLYLGMSAYHDTSLYAKVYEYDPETFTLTDKTGTASYLNHSVWGIYYSTTNTKLVVVFGNDQPSDTDRVCDIKIATAAYTAGTGAMANLAEVYDSEDGAEAGTIAPCDFCYRDGDSYGWTGGALNYYARGIGYWEAAAAISFPGRWYGENLTLPLQYVRSAAGNYQSQIRSAINDGDPHPDGTTTSTGYCAWFSSPAYVAWLENTYANAPSSPSIPPELNVKHSIGQRRCMAWCDDRFYFWRYASATYYLDYYDVSGDTEANVLSWSEHGTGTNYHREPTCMAVVDSGGAHMLYVGQIDWNDSQTTSHVPSIAKVERYDNTGTLQHTKTFNSGAETYAVPIALEPIATSGDYGVAGCLLTRDSSTPDGKLYGLPFSVFGLSNTCNSATIINNLYSSMPLLGWAHNGASSSSYDRVYFVDTASGMTYYLKRSDVTVYRCNSLGGSGVDSELNLATQRLTIDYNDTATSEIVYGVSAPNIHKNALELPAPGRYELCKLANSVNYIIPLADFSGRNGWEAISDLLVPLDYTRKIDETAAFEAAPRSTTVPATTYTLVDSRQPCDTSPDPSTGYITVLPVKLSMNRGYDQVANYVAIKPYTVTLGEVTGRGTFVKRPQGASSDEGMDDFNCELVANQGDTAAHSIILDCVKQGQPVAHDNATYPMVMFRGYLYKQEISTVLTDNASTSSYGINVRDIGNRGLTIAPGDFVQIGDDELNRIKAEKTCVVLHDNYVTLTLTAYPSAAYDAGTRVTIWKQDHLQATDSDYGVTQLETGVTNETTWQVESVKRISVGTILHPVGTDEYVLVTTVTPDADANYDTIEVTRAIARSPEAASIAAGTVLKGYWAPQTTNSQYEIFGTGITLGIYPPDDVDATTGQQTFLVGDKIKVEAKGLVLEEQAASILEAEAVPSQKMYGKQEYGGAEIKYNRFMGYILGTEIVKRIRTNEKYPHRRFKADLGRFFYGLEPLDNVYVQSRKYLPAETNNTIACSILTVTHTLPSATQRGNTVLELRAISGAIL